MQLVLRHVLTKEAVGHAAFDILEGIVAQMGEKLGGEGYDALWHVEAAVFGQALHHGLLQ